MMTRLAYFGLCAAVFVSGCGPSPASLRDRGIAEFQVGHIDDAESLLRQAVDARPAMPEALYYLGRVNYATGDLEQAIYYYQCSLDVDPSFTPARRWLTKAQQEAGRTGQLLLFIP